MHNDAKQFRVSDVAGVTMGYPLRGSAERLESGDVRLVQLKNVSIESGVDWEAVSQVSLPSGRAPAWLTSSDVVFSSRGTRTLAYPILNPPPRAVCAPQFFVLSIRDTAAVLPEFVAWQINQKPAQEYLQRNATGDYIRNIRREVIEGLELTLPPVNAQRHIVNLWRTAVRERTVLNRLIEIRSNQLEAIALRLFQPQGQRK